jgi:hypothetical protein
MCSCTFSTIICNLIIFFALHRRWKKNSNSAIRCSYNAIFSCECHQCDTFYQLQSIFSVCVLINTTIQFNFLDSSRTELSSFFFEEILQLNQIFKLPMPNFNARFSKFRSSLLTAFSISFSENKIVIRLFLLCELILFYRSVSHQIISFCSMIRKIYLNVRKLVFMH